MPHEGELDRGPGDVPVEGGGPAEMIAQGLQAMLESAPTPEVAERIQAVMAELGEIAGVMESGGPEQAAPQGQSAVGQPQQGSPVV